MIGMAHLRLFEDHNHKKYYGCKGICSKRSSRRNKIVRREIKRPLERVAFFELVKPNVERSARGVGEERAGFDGREITVFRGATHQRFAVLAETHFLAALLLTIDAGADADDDQIALAGVEITVVGALRNHHALV